MEYKTGYNCDNAYEVGKIKTYIISGSNLPSDFSGGAFVISICNPSSWSANNYIVQIAFDATNTYNYTFFTRKHAAGGWTSWVKYGGAT